MYTYFWIIPSFCSTESTTRLRLSLIKNKTRFHNKKNWAPLTMFCGPYFSRSQNQMTHRQLNTTNYHKAPKQTENWNLNNKINVVRHSIFGHDGQQMSLTLKTCLGVVSNVEHFDFYKILFQWLSNFEMSRLIRFPVNPIPENRKSGVFGFLFSFDSE